LKTTIPTSEVGNFFNGSRHWFLTREVYDWVIGYNMVEEY